MKKNIKYIVTLAIHFCHPSKLLLRGHMSDQKQNEWVMDVPLMKGKLYLLQAILMLRRKQVIDTRVSMLQVNDMHVHVLVQGMIGIDGQVVHQSDAFSFQASVTTFGDTGGSG
jgi:hypothetical protein